MVGSPPQAITILPETTSTPKLRGRYDFHNNVISWSYLILGNDALIHTKNIAMKLVFIPSINVELIPANVHPPKKSSENKPDINIMLAYSAKNNNAKDIEEYSTLYPETSSDSPSVKSNGALFVSATREIRNIIEHGNKAIKKKWSIIL